MDASHILIMLNNTVTHFDYALILLYYENQPLFTDKKQQIVSSKFK